MIRRLLVPAGLALALCVAPAVAGDCFNPWTDLGNGLAGSSGEPQLAGYGSLVGGTRVTLSLTDALPGAPASLVVGFSALEAPFKGGVLVPSADFVLSGFLTGPLGGVEISAKWPEGVPDGTDVRYQFWVSDAGAPQGFAASNGVRGVASAAPTAGTLPADWISGTDCAGDPLFQVHSYDADTFILRQSMCTNFEGPFLYLLMGEDRALLLDTGANGAGPVQATVRGLIDSWAAGKGIPAPPLTVGHTHSHGDHVANDNQFQGQPNTTVVGLSPGQVANFFGFQDWPNDQVTYDLGGCRQLDLIAIPGHENSHIAVYDRTTGLLITGDTFYPGFLFIFGAVSQGNFVKYQDSIVRLVDFIVDKPVTWVMGTHIEMTAVPGVAYPYGTTVQPDERELQLTLPLLIELRDAVLDMGSSPVEEVHDDFIIQPFG